MVKVYVVLAQMHMSGEFAEQSQTLGKYYFQLATNRTVDSPSPLGHYSRHSTGQQLRMTWAIASFKRRALFFFQSIYWDAKNLYSNLAVLLLSIYLYQKRYRLLSLLLLDKAEG